MHGAGATGAAAAYQYIANATKASGGIIRVELEEFQKILNKIEKPLVVVAPPGFLSNKHKYLTGYRGFFFFTQTAEDFPIGGNVELIKADKIWVPE